MTAEIISIGTELLMGQIVNTNEQFLSRRLSMLGIQVFHTQTVGDNAARLKEALITALSRSNIVVTTGGLGPTADDITKQIVAEIAGVRLAHCSAAEKRITDYYERNKRTVPEICLNQAMLPDGCKVLLNDYGTAPGCIVDVGGKNVVMLPGPPREMEPMFINQVEAQLLPYQDDVLLSKYIRVFGVSEATLQEKLDDLIGGKNPTVAPYAKTGEVELRVTAKSLSEERATAMCNSVADIIRERVGYKVYTDKYASLQETAVMKLIENGQTVATAESCTGGLLGKRITEIPGSSQIYALGVCTYSNDAKKKVLGVREETLEKFGAVSYQTAIEMAEGIRQISHASVGVSITGVAGPGSDDRGTAVGTVFIALADSLSVYCREVHIGRGGNERELVREIAASHALDMMRLFAEGQYDKIGNAVPVPEVDTPSKSFDVIAVNPHIAANNQKTKSLSGQSENKKSMKKKRGGFFTDFPTDSVGEKIRKIIMLLAIAVLIVSGTLLGMHFLDEHKSKEAEKEIDNLMTQSEELTDEEADEIRQTINIDGINEAQKWSLMLLQKNKDLVGRLSVTSVDGDKSLDQVVTQSSNNDYYINHDFFGNASTLGNPFLDYRCDKKNLSANSIIFGHSTQNSNMKFDPLHKYESLSFMNKNPVVEYDSIYNNYQWKIFAVMIVNTDTSKGEVFNYIQTDFDSEGSFNSFIDNCRKRSMYNTDVDVNYSDKLLTLSTCSFKLDGARLVIVARMVRDGESTEVSAATKNPQPIYYQAWVEKYKEGTYINTTEQSGTASGDFAEQSKVYQINSTSFTALDTAVYCDKNGKITFSMPYVNSFDTAVSISRETKPANGKVTIMSAKNSITYTPNAGFTGTDSFDILVSDDGLTNTSSATVTVYVGEKPTSGVTFTEEKSTVNCGKGETIDFTVPVSPNSGAIFYAVSQYEGIKYGSFKFSNDGVLSYTAANQSYTDTVKIVCVDENVVGGTYILTVKVGNGVNTEQKVEETNTTPSKNETQTPSKNESSNSSKAESQTPSKDESSEISSNTESQTPPDSSDDASKPSEPETPAESET